MTHLEDIIRILDEAGVGYDIKTIYRETPGYAEVERKILTLCHHDHNNVLGYQGFFTEMTFNNKGQLLSIGAYE